MNEFLKVQLAEWRKLKTQLDQVKDAEMALRKEIVAVLNDGSNRTQTHEIENGWKCKFKQGVNYGFVKNADKKVDRAAIEAVLQEIEKGPNGDLIAERLIKWTPELSLTEYKLLSDHNKALIDTVLVTTDAAPTLELVPPKGSK